MTVTVEIGQANIKDETKGKSLTQMQAEEDANSPLKQLERRVEALEKK